MSLLESCLKYCCCNGENSDDEEHLIREQGEETRINRRERVDRYNNISNGPEQQPGVSRNGQVIGQVSNGVKTREQVEQELLKKILDRTEQSIIDVSNMDNTTVDVDVAYRARVYSDAIRRHDEAITKKKSPAKEDSLPVSSLLSDVGPRLQEFLSHPSITPDEVALIHQWTEACLEAYKQGVQIECKEELVAYMSLDD